MNRQMRTIRVAGVALVVIGLATTVGLRWRSAHSPAQLSPALATMAPLCVKAAQIFCEKLEQCGGLAAAQSQACIERHARDCEADLGWRLRKGVRLLDEEAQEECIEGLHDANCGAVMSVLGDDDQDIFELTDRCELDELRPNSRLDDACALPSDCKEGSCPYSELGCHTCRAFASIGATCTLGGDACDPTRAYCNLGDAGGHCAGLKTNGAACERGEECAGGICRNADAGGRQCSATADAIDCRESRDCATTSYCRHGADGSRCSPRVKTGEKCSPDARENSCLDAEARCVGSRCVVRPFSEPQGAPCHDLSDCRSGLYCRNSDGAEGNGLCAPQLRAGEACRPVDYGACILSTRCVGGSCLALGAEGASCAGPYQCLAELECIPNSADAGFSGGATCERPQETGRACGPFRSCRTGFCRMSGAVGVCVAKSRAGALCETREECASDRCQSAGDGGPARCQGPCD